MCGVFLGGRVLVSLCCDGGYRGCKSEFRGIVDVARLFVVKATRATNLLSGLRILDFLNHLRLPE